MKNILLLLLLFTNCIKAQSLFLGRKVSSQPKQISLIIFSGESNSGGKALNTDATTNELAVRPKVKILNNSTLLLEDLHIGVNNNIGHDNLINGTTHGWELGLGNIVDSGNLPNPIYITKTGQGGSGIDQWNPTATVKYYDSLTKRVDSAKKLITAINNGVAPNLYLFYSQGINDALYVPNDSANWISKTEAHFANIRARYGSVPIFITYLPPAFNSYNARITQICSEVTECYAIQTSDLPMQDSYHWNYSAMKTIASRMIATLKSHYTYN